MQIRSITYFLKPGNPLNHQQLKAAGAFIKAAKPAFEDVGYVVQTSRLATVPFPTLFPTLNAKEMVSYARQFEAAAAEQGAAYVSLGPALPEYPHSYAVLPEILASTENVFVGGVIADLKMGVSLPAVRACGEVIHALATQQANGFGNLYFAALANVPAGAPFFPAAYHAGSDPVFALALEAADLAVEAFSGSSSLNQARNLLVSSIEAHADLLISTANRLSNENKVGFIGLDFTLAPFPEQKRSLGTALERLGIPAVGMQGTLAAAAFLASSLDQAVFQRTGFNGLMLPVLEDACLAQRASEGVLSINDLLIYSAVCGTGLDTIPLPGNTSPEALSALLLDVSALALRLDKPLTARLMPIPGLQAGDTTFFNFPYFANSRVLELGALPLSGFFSGSETLLLHPRQPKQE